MKELIRNVLDFVYFLSPLYWELSVCQVSEERKYKLKSSHTFEERGRFVTKLLWMYVKIYIVHKKDDFFGVLYLYRPVQRNVNRRWEAESEKLVGVTCGELLAMWIAGTLKGKIPSFSWYIYRFCYFCLKNNYKLEGKVKKSYFHVRFM